MTNIKNILILTNHEMNGAGFQAYFEHNLPENKVSIFLVPALYNFNNFDLSLIDQTSVLVIDCDDFIESKLLKFLKTLKEQNKKVIIYSKLKSPGLLLKVRSFLLSGYVSKSSSMSKIIDCIKVIEFGGVYYDSIFDSLVLSLNSLFESISQTQRKLLCELLLYEDISIRELSDLLGIAKHSAEVHLSKLYKETGTSNYSELIKHFSI